MGALLTTMCSAQWRDEQSQRRGVCGVQGLLEMTGKYPIIDIRGRGLMCAVEFGGRNGGMSAEPGVAAAVTKAAGRRNMLLLTAGARMDSLGVCNF